MAFGHEEANRRLLDILRAEGFNPEDLVKQGRLSVIGGQPSWQAMLDEIARAFGEATSNGYACIRVLGNIGWEKMGWPSHEDILVFEAHVTQAAQRFPCVVVCMYAMGQLPARTLYHGGFETHPRIATANRVLENFHYVETGEFLDQFSKKP